MDTDPRSAPDPSGMPGRPTWTPDATEPEPAVDAEPAAAEAEPAPLPLLAPHHPRSRAVPGLLSIAAAIAIGGLAFAAGRLTGTAGDAAAAANGGPGGLPPASGAPGAGGFGLFDGGAATIEGMVVSVADGQLTIQTSDGRTVTVATSGTTTYHSAGAATASDVATGQTVSVQVSRGQNAPTSSASTSGGASAEDVTITGE